jgi:transporter family protein
LLQSDVAGRLTERISALSVIACLLPFMNWLVWSLLSAFFAGATAVLAKVGVSNVNSNLATAIRTTVVLGFTWILALATAPPSALGKISLRAWVFLALSGLATGLSWVCYFRALQVGEASRVAPVDKLSVVFVLAFAALFLHEPLTWRHWAGGLLIVAGAVILASV